MDAPPHVSKRQARWGHLTTLRPSAPQSVWSLPLWGSDHSSRDLCLAHQLVPRIFCYSAVSLYIRLGLHVSDSNMVTSLFFNFCHQNARKTTWKPKTKKKEKNPSKNRKRVHKNKKTESQGKRSVRHTWRSQLTPEWSLRGFGMIAP